MSAGLLLWDGGAGVARLPRPCSGWVGGDGIGGGGGILRLGGILRGGGQSGGGIGGRGGAGDDDHRLIRRSVAVQMQGQKILGHTLGDGLGFLPVGIVADDALVVQRAGHKPILSEHHGAVGHTRHEIIVPLQAVAVVGGILIVDVRRHGGVVYSLGRGIGEGGGIERPEPVGL